MSDQYDGPKTSEFKVWHIPQVPGRPFIVEADTIEEARRYQDVLAFYDLFQYENRIKPDYSNVSGIMLWCPDEKCYVDVDEEELKEQAPDREDMPWYKRLISANLDR